MKESNNKRTFCFLLLFSIIFIAVATVVTVKNIVYSKQGVKTQATIIKIEKNYNNYADDDVTYNVYVEFFVGEEKFTGKLDTYVSSMKKGKKVPIYYMPDNPNDFTYAGQPLLLPAILYGVGAITLSIALAFPISAAKKKNLEKFKKDATTIKARITDVDFNDLLSVMGKHKLKIKCSDDCGTEYSASQYVTNGTNAFIGKEITVYLGNNNKYKIDLQEVCEPQIKQN